MAEIRTALDSVGGRRRLDYLVVAALAGFTVLVAAASIVAGAGAVWARIVSLPADLVVQLLLLSLVNYGLRCWRWQRFGDGLGLRVPAGRNALYFVAGFAMTTTPGKAGEALRLWLLERCHGLAYERVTPMFIGDRLNDMAAVVLLCLAGVGAFAGYAPYAAVAGVSMLVLLGLFLRPELLLGLVNRLWGAFGRRAPRLFARARATIRDTQRLLTIRLFGVGLAMALVGWGCEALAFYLLLHALGGDIGFRAATFTFTFAMAAGTVALLPGGLGGTEAIMVALLSGQGMAFDAAVAATAVIRLTTLWFASGLGFVALPFAMRLARRRFVRPVAA